ncbi:STK_08120 family protein [Sulfurisphaera tokodaii]|uniref:Uncharacterized protein n=2 Tax=Sulfurisphaera tokodaii TaxID=111955 RepID=Q96ZH2_SULTO|nr:STK_08120 family protein [Sulfurisphaera tokodaii]BAB66953.1 hypothetical protein STK_18620 [Sulfurisphaera tokodaii str. 7]HII75393.1 DUF3211 family protein [Sulfurisphaera tokodaii]
MELEYNFETNTPKDVILEYISNPENLLKYVPAFKSLKRLDENSWELEVKWLFTIKLKVKRIIGTDEVTYTIEKTEGLIKISASLRYVILTPKNRNTILKIIFSYEGPFESIAKKQTEEYYRRGVEIFKRDLEKLEEKHLNIQRVTTKFDILNMKTILAKGIKRGEIEDILTRAMIESVNSRVLVILSDDKTIVELIFENGSLEDSKGDINTLGENIKVLMKISQIMETKNRTS